MISMSLSKAAALLQAEFTGGDVTFTGCSIDSRTLKQGNLFIALRGERFDGHSFINAAQKKGASAAMVQSSVDVENLPLLIIEDTKQAMGRLAGYWRDNFSIPLLAVTGSNGKTTVKEMIGSILGLNASVLVTRGNLNNDIGVPITLFGLGREHHYAVIEMGANHAGEIAWLSRLARPTVALITQCAPAHLEGFGSIEGVARAKAEIFSGLDPAGTAILNADDNYFNFWMDTTSQFRQLSFGIKNKADVTATDIRFDSASAKTTFLMHTPGSSVAISLALVGEHNVMNALAAATCCLAVGIPVSHIKTGLEQVVTVSGRMQLKLTPEGARIFDDTYNANPVSLQAGLKVMSSMPGRKWLLLGDMGELGEHSTDLHREAGEMAREYGMERLYALGDLSKHAVDGFGSGARHFNGTDELLDVISTELTADTTLLVKGSRRMGMDRIVKFLVGGR